MAQRQFNKKVRFVLNILFTIVVILGIVMGWNKEIDDPDAWFPNEVTKTEPVPAPVVSEQPVTDKK